MTYNVENQTGSAWILKNTVKKSMSVIITIFENVHIYIHDYDFIFEFIGIHK